MVQVEMFEEEDSSILQEEINKFLEKIDDERILKVDIDTKPIILSSGVLMILYEGVVMNKVK